MLREKRFSINKTYRNKISNSHFINLLQSHKNKQNNHPESQFDFTQFKKETFSQSNPLREKIDHQNIISKQETKMIKDVSNNFQADVFPNYDFNMKERQKQKLYVKISQLIKNQQLYISKNNDKINKIDGILKDRPYTSLSQKKYMSERKSLGKYSYILCVPNKENQQIEPERISTSRALIQYSKIYKNISNPKIRRKKEKNQIQNFIQLSTQRINFSQKQKQQKEKIDFTSFIKNGIRHSHSKKKSISHRYEQDVQSFEIGAWDYFQ